MIPDRELTSTLTHAARFILAIEPEERDELAGRLALARPAIHTMLSWPGAEGPILVILHHVEDAHRALVRELRRTVPNPIIVRGLQDALVQTMMFMEELPNNTSGGDIHDS